MQNFQIHFTYPYLLLALVVGLGLTALLHFQISKKYRKTRNRIVSLVLHIIVYTLAVLTLAGIHFSYTVPNETNEILLVVDVSDTEERSAETRDAFVQTVLSQGRYDSFKIGVVTFGYDQTYAVPITRDVDSIYDQYLAAESPDTSATNIAAALTYASTLFEKTENAKIVLVTDGKETDERAEAVIRTLSAKGIRVDIANIPSQYEGADMQFTAMDLPTYHIALEEEVRLSGSIFSNGEGTVTIDFFDNDVLVNTQAIEVQPGNQAFYFTHAFTEYGLHRLTFKTRNLLDELEANNTYCSYLNLEEFNNILILEQRSGDSTHLKSLLENAPQPFNVTVLNTADIDQLPKTLHDLRMYDQVILNNIANKDLAPAFVDMLYTYVHDCGGGLFTVGGTEPDNTTAHAYNRKDMTNTKLQEILPVQAINYTPPLALVVIIDRSGSMSKADGLTGMSYLDLALSGAKSCLNAMSERDYFGLMTLDSSYEVILPLTPRTQESIIIDAINSIHELGPTGGTVFPEPIEKACQALRSVDVAKKHILLVTDGGVPAGQKEAYEGYIKQYHESDGITLSVVGIGIEAGSSTAAAMKAACDLGGGRLHTIADANDLTYEMREDLNVPEIKEVNYETFYPRSKNPLSPIFNNVGFQTLENEKTTDLLTASLDGFFGVRVKPGAELLLTGDYNVPIYAQWKFGLGAVGSFMCDLNGTWSADFLNLSNSNNGSGRNFLINAITALMPLSSIRENSISVDIKQDNYTNQLSVYTPLEEGQYVYGQITNLTTGGEPIPLNEITIVEEGERLTDLDCYTTNHLSAANNYSRANFVIKQGGVYKFEFFKRDAEGNDVEQLVLHRSFSFSEEYDQTMETTDTEYAEMLKDLAALANGSLIEDIEDPYEVFANFVTDIHNTFDPRILFMILVIVLFLADIAVRKFKFKWPHELIREHREKRKS